MQNNKQSKRVAELLLQQTAGAHFFLLIRMQIFNLKREQKQNATSQTKTQ